MMTGYYIIYRILYMQETTLLGRKTTHVDRKIYNNIVYYISKENIHLVRLIYTNIVHHISSKPHIFTGYYNVI